VTAVRSLDRLAVDVARLLAHYPEGLGFREVAMHVGARANTVRCLLLDDPRFSGPFHKPEAPRRHLYKLAIFEASPPLSSGGLTASRPTPNPGAAGSPSPGISA